MAKSVGVSLKNFMVDLKFGASVVWFSVSPSEKKWLTQVLSVDHSKQTGDSIMPIGYLIIFLENAMNVDQIENRSVGLKGKFGMKLKPDLTYTPNQTAGQSRVTRRVFLAPGIMGLVLGLSGCMIVDSPIKGVLGTEVFWGDIATGKSGSSEPGELKQGKACAESILGLLARGDASVRAAKENGNISEVTSVDHSARNLLNIVGEWCTIVRGH
jgi:hypothetical protein